jgi:hypothetical protein
MRARGGTCALLASVVTLAACSTSSDSSDPPAAAGDSASNALHLPTLAEGARCPTSPRRPTAPDFGPGLGNGPVYPIGFSASGELVAEFPPFQPSHQFAGSGWGGAKVLWVSDPTYEGPIRIRGRRLDGTGVVRFNLDLVHELRFARGSSQAASGSGWREFPSHTRVQAPGCYGYQVDGAGFSDVIVFGVKAG